MAGGSAPVLGRTTPGAAAAAPPCQEPSECEVVKTGSPFGRHSRLLGVFQHWADIWSRSGWRVQTHYRTGAARVIDPQHGIAAVGTEPDCLDLAASLAPSAERPKAVILLHGLGHHPGGMDNLTRALDGTAGRWRTWLTPACADRSRAMASAASRIARAMIADGAGSVSMIGHSLGGLVAGAAMAHANRRWLDRRDRLVLIGSPARGAAIADVLKSLCRLPDDSGACGQAITPAGAAGIPVPDCGILLIAGGNGGRRLQPAAARRQ